MKLSREMERALAELHRPRSSSIAGGYTLANYLRETFVGRGTVRALMDRELVELTKPKGGFAQVAVFTRIELTEKGKPLAELAWKVRNARLHAAAAAFAGERRSK